MSVISVSPQSSQTQKAVSDIVRGVKLWRIWGYVAWNDIHQRYRRSALGPLWLTISMAVMVFAIGTLYSRILKTDVANYLPFFCTSILVWTFCATVIGESCNAFIQSESLIKQLSFPYTIHVLRVAWRNIIVFLHHCIIYVFVAFYFQLDVISYIWQVIPGALLVFTNLLWIGLLVAIICARFRDFPQIVQNILQVMIFLTPILWKPDNITGNMQIIIMLNPFYHLIELMRAPMLGHHIMPASWIACSLFAFFGWSLTFMFFRRFRRRIAYWL